MKGVKCTKLQKFMTIIGNLRHCDQVPGYNVYFMIILTITCVKVYVPQKLMVYPLYMMTP